MERSLTLPTRDSKKDSLRSTKQRYEGHETVGDFKCCDSKPSGRTCINKNPNNTYVHTFILDFTRPLKAMTIQITCHWPQKALTIVELSCL